MNRSNSHTITNIDFDTLVPNFRQAQERWPHAPTLLSHYLSLVDSYSTNSFAIIEIIKSFIEAVCLTILVDFGKSMPTATPNTTEMLVETLKCLGLENSRGASKLDKVLSAYNRLADALTEMRNENGQIAHGKDGFLDPLTRDHTRAFLFIGDSLIGLLLSAIEGKDPDLKYTREPYERFSHLHDRIDYSVQVETSIDEDEEFPMIQVKFQVVGMSDEIELLIEPSRLLYHIDRTAYIELLSSSEIRQVEVPPTVEVPEIPSVKLQDTSPSVQIIRSYEGFLSSLRIELERYLSTFGLSKIISASGEQKIIDSILATAEANMGLDWTSRDVLQAKIKVALGRVLITFGVEREESKKIAEHLVTWFKIQLLN
jgi:hypothetical protein